MPNKLSAWCALYALAALFFTPWVVAEETCYLAPLSQIEAMQDESGTLTATDIAALPSERFGSLYSPPFPLEFTRAVVWLRFTVLNPNTHRCMNWLSVGEPRLDNVRVYQQERDGWLEMHAGSDYPVSEWVVATRQPLFPMSLAPQETQQVLVEVRSRSVMMIEPRLWGQLEQVIATQRLALGDGLALGIVLLIVPFSLIIGLLIRSPLVLINAMAILAYILLSCVVNGYLFYLPELLPWAHPLVGVLSFGSFIFFMAYVRVLFQVRLMSRPWRYLLTLYTLGMAGVLLWGAVGDYVATRILFSELRWLNYVMVPLLFAVAWWQGLRPNWLAWSLTGLFVFQGISRHFLAVKNVPWQYGEDQLGLLSSLPAVLLLVGTLIMEFRRSRLGERRALSELEELQKAAQERLESTVARRTEQLSESLRARSSLLARISHDLRSPLVSIIDYARLLRAQVTHEYPAKIERNARQQLEMIDELLEFSRSELQQLELVVAPGYLYGFVHEVEDEGRFLALRQDNRFISHFAADLPLLVRADFRRLRQVLINLLANAAKFTRDGQIEFSVLCMSSDADSSTLLFSVRDSGIGLHVDELEQLLQPFRRGRDAARYDGSGLGLSIVSQLLAQMGSRLQVEALPGRGSQFSFSLQLARANEQEFDLLLSGQAQTAIQGQGRRVLVVDDIEQNRESVADLLAGFDFEVTLASGGDQALDMLEQQAVDLLITDQMMPGFDGWQLLQAVREQWPQLPVLLYSAAPPLRPGNLDGLLAFDAALLKPASSDDLLARVALLLAVKTDAANPRP